MGSKVGVGATDEVGRGAGFSWLICGIKTVDPTGVNVSVVWVRGVGAGRVWVV